jgi:tetratricopeptide (TPR) repeat protein
LEPAEPCAESQRKSWGFLILLLILVVYFSPLFPSGGIVPEYRLAGILSFSLLFIVFLLISWRASATLSWPREVGVFFFFFLLSGLVSLISSVSINLSLKEVLFLLTQPLFLLFTYNILKEVSNRWLGYFVLIVGGLASFHGLYQTFTAQYGTFSYILNRRIDIAFTTGRSHAYFSSPNHLAALLEMILPLLLWLFFQREGRWRFASGFVLVFVVAVQILTFSKTGLVIFVGLAFFYFIFVARQGEFSIQTILSLILILTVAFSFVVMAWSVQKISSGQGSELGAAFGGVPQSLKQRASLWSSSINALVKKPLTGWGAGSFRKVLPLFQVDGFYAKYAHNDYLEFLVSQGTLSFLSLFFLLFLTLFSLVKGWREASGLQVATALGASGFLLHSFFDYLWSVFSLSLLFWLFVSVFLIGRRRGFSRQPLIHLGCLGLALTCLLVSIPAFLGVYHEVKGAGNFLTNQKSKAQIHLKKAITYWPWPGDAYFYLGRLSEKTHPKQAEKYYLKNVVGEPIEPEYHVAYGLFLSNQGKFKQAEMEFLEAVRLYPKDPHYLLSLGLFYQQWKYYPEAALAFYSAINLEKYYQSGIGDPRISQDFQSAYVNLAQAYLKLGLKKQALEVVEELLLLYPDNPVGLELERELRQSI